jgi:hypothetical protein
MKLTTTILAALLVGCAALTAECNQTNCICETPFYAQENLTQKIPEITIDSREYGYDKASDVAQYKNADWSQVVGIMKETTLENALKYAQNHDEVTFFFYVKGYQMVLETENGDYRLFHQGDAVFFKGTPWWGSAPGLADGYVKISNQ